MANSKIFLVDFLRTEKISIIPPRSQCRMDKTDLLKLYEFLKDISDRLGVVEDILKRNNIT